MDKSISLAVKNLQKKITFWDFSRFSITEAQNLFLDSKSTPRTFNILEATSWHIIFMVQWEKQKMKIFLDEKLP